MKTYKGYYICKFKTEKDKYFRVKNDPKDDYSIHHGSFDTVKDAKKWIDSK